MPDAQSLAEALPAPAPFLGARLTLRQPAGGYRAAVDTVLLGAAVGGLIQAGEAGLEMGAGTGAASLVAALWRPALRLRMIEIDAGLAHVSAVNAADNGFSDRLTADTANALELSPADRDAADLVLLNPPFLDEGAGRAPADPARASAFVAGEGGLTAWIDAALARAKSGGRLVVIQRADRLDDTLARLAGRAGAIRIKPVAPIEGAPAKRVLIAARKGAKGPLTLLSPLVLHDPDGTPTQNARALLEGERPLAWDA